MNRDDFGNALGRHTQCVVSLAETIEQAQFRVNLTQPFVVDDEQGINVPGHLFHTVQCLVNLLGSLETEGDGDDAHGKNPQFLAHTCNDRCSTRTGSTAHPSGNKRHLRPVVQHVLDVFNGVFSSLARTFRPVSCTKSFLAQLEMNRHGRVVECLCIRIA